MVHQTLSQTTKHVKATKHTSTDRFSSTPHIEQTDQGNKQTKVGVEQTAEYKLGPNSIYLDFGRNRQCLPNFLAHSMPLVYSHLNCSLKKKWSGRLLNIILLITLLLCIIFLSLKAIPMNGIQIVGVHYKLFQFKETLKPRQRKQSRRLAETAESRISQLDAPVATCMRCRNSRGTGSDQLTALRPHSETVCKW